MYNECYWRAYSWDSATMVIINQIHVTRHYKYYRDLWYIYPIFFVTCDLWDMLWIMSGGLVHARSKVYSRLWTEFRCPGFSSKTRLHVQPSAIDDKIKVLRYQFMYYNLSNYILIRADLFLKLNNYFKRISIR